MPKKRSYLGACCAISTKQQRKALEEINKNISVKAVRNALVAH